MPRWIVFCVVGVAYSFIMVPIERAIYKKISRRWIAYIATVIVAIMLLLGLYGLAALCGFSIWK